MPENNTEKIEAYYAQKRDKILNTAERQRIEAYTKYLHNNDDPQGKNWRKWGCYLSERQWGTIRENYGPYDDTWGDRRQPGTFYRDQALHRAYRWGEDGIAGISDDHQFLCFALSLWNGEDPCIKERLYGLTNGEGVHGEDVKEYYFYLDNTPTHAYMKYLYKYPYLYPYEKLYNQKDSIRPFEYELVNTGAFDENRYFDVRTEYAKDDVEDIYIKITVKNNGPETKTLHLLPTVWFRNIGSFKEDYYDKALYYAQKGSGAIGIVQKDTVHGDKVVSQMWLYAGGDKEAILYTKNETDNQEAFHSSNDDRTYFKNGIHHYILGKFRDGKNEAELAKFADSGQPNDQANYSKAAVHYKLDLKPGETRIIHLRLSNVETDQPFDRFDAVFDSRIRETDDFYDAVSPYDRNGSGRERELYSIQRQALAGMLWNKQLYYFVVKEWLNGDKIEPSQAHKTDQVMTPWQHLYCKDILLMPDKWEYPWFAAWDLAFHTVTVAMIDPEFAKHQLLLMTMEWYMHPDGQIPAYEWNFSDSNPPVHAWAVLSVYRLEKLMYGKVDTEFLERVFEKLNMNFTYWVNKKDSEGNNLFGGGFLGLDNIRVKTGDFLEQSDGTAWMAMFCLNMMKMANELKKYDLERKYLQHFIYISDAMNNLGLWDQGEGFFFDAVRGKGPLKVFSVVGLVPLFAIEKLHKHMNEEYDSDSFYSLNGTLAWFKREKRDDLFKPNGYDQVTLTHILDGLEPFKGSLEGFISLVDPKKLEEILKKVLNSKMFLSDFGIRSLAKNTNGSVDGIVYESAESNTGGSEKGGNSNWRGPIWFCINYLLIESLRKFHAYLGDGTLITYPNTGEKKTLDEVCDDLSTRLIQIFRKGPDGKRPVYGGQKLFERPGWEDLILFYEYFDGDRGIGLGAGHQTGWTGLVANLIQEMGVRENALGCAETESLAEYCTV